MAAIINYYDLEAPDETATTLDEVAEYVDYLADFFAEKMGMFIREDLTVKSPSYAQYSYVKFLSLTDGGDPVLCVYNINKNAFPDAAVNFVFDVCTASSDVWMPARVYDYPFNNMAIGAYRDIGNVIGNMSWNTRKRTLKVIKLNDGRVYGILQAYIISTGARENAYESCSFLITSISIENNIEKTLVLGEPFRSSYMTKYDRFPSGNTVSTLAYAKIANNSIYNALGFTDLNKEYLIKYNLNLGSNCYIPNMAMFSNRQHSYAGNLVTINGKKYILYSCNSSDSAYVIPEEVN